MFYCYKHVSNKFQLCFKLIYEADPKLLSIYSVIYYYYY